MSVPAALPFAHLAASAQDLGLPRAEALGLVGVIGLSSIAGRFALGALADELGRRATFLSCCAGVAAATLLWAAADGALLLRVFAFGALYGGFVALLPALVADCFGRRSPGDATGLLHTGRGVAPLAGPPAVALAAPGQAGGHALPAAATGALGALGTVLLARARGRPERAVRRAAPARPELLDGGRPGYAWPRKHWSADHGNDRPVQDLRLRHRGADRALRNGREPRALHPRPGLARAGGVRRLRRAREAGAALPRRDRGGRRRHLPPREEHVAELLAFGRDLAAEPPPEAHLLVHCHAGVSRSTASMALLLAQTLPGAGADRVFGEVLRVRPQAWPNLRIVEMGDALLGRGGALVEAARGVYRRQLEARPHLAEEFRRHGRGREVAAALGG